MPPQIENNEKRTKLKAITHVLTYIFSFFVILIVLQGTVFNLFDKNHFISQLDEIVDNNEANMFGIFLIVFYCIGLVYSILLIVKELKSKSSWIKKSIFVFLCLIIISIILYPVIYLLLLN